MDRQPLLRALRDRPLHTPAFVYDEAQLFADIRHARSAFGTGSAELLFALKSFAIEGGLRVIAAHVEGFHASSLFEAKLARYLLKGSGTVHLTTPGLRADEIHEICDLCDVVTFNSMSQWERFREIATSKVKCGLRVNPQLSVLDDERYDPCRRHSKLGEPINRLSDIALHAPDRLEGLSGVLVHNNCEARDFRSLLQTVMRVTDQLGPLLRRLDWINLGGGYLFYGADDLTPLGDAIRRLRNDYRLNIVFEPGASIVDRAGYFVASVVDLFESEGKQIAVLDTSVNHMPEAFEYQFSPDVVGQVADGHWVYLLAGCTCLAGDLFGTYAFGEPLTVGSRLIFENAGAYTLVKAHFFNGVNLPTIYAFTQDGHLRLERRYSFDDFLVHCGVSGCGRP